MQIRVFIIEYNIRFYTLLPEMNGNERYARLFTFSSFLPSLYITGSDFFCILSLSFRKQLQGARQDKATIKAV